MNNGQPQRQAADSQRKAQTPIVVLQCLTSTAGTLIGESLGSTIPGKLAAGICCAGVGAFLTAPGGHHRRRIVAVALLIVLVDALRRASSALARSTPRRSRESKPSAWMPANWVAVGLTATVGFALGSGITTVRGAWTSDGVFASVPEVRGQSKASAIQTLSDAQLTATGATEPSESIPRGDATRTDPPAGAEVLRESRVTLFISAGPPPAQCGDGQDNDRDGFTDANDPGCGDGTEAPINPRPEGDCNDGQDNDGDTFIDRDDPGCGDGTEAPINPRPERECNDGQDNDGDGLVDGRDRGCASADDDDETTPGSETETTDIDRDGFSRLDDCNDRDASIHPQATEIFGDGIDQDCDGVDPEGPD